MLLACNELNYTCVKSLKCVEFESHAQGQSCVIYSTLATLLLKKTAYLLVSLSLLYWGKVMVAHIKPLQRKKVKGQEAREIRLSLLILDLKDGRL